MAPFSEPKPAVDLVAYKIFPKNSLRQDQWYILPIFEGYHDIDLSGCVSEKSSMLVHSLSDPRRFRPISSKGSESAANAICVSSLSSENIYQVSEAAWDRLRQLASNGCKWFRFV